MGKTNATPQLLNFFTIGKISSVFKKNGLRNIFAIITNAKIWLAYVMSPEFLLYLFIG
jgi:hypothetical protein